MGGAKRMLDEHEDKEAVAIAIALQAKLLQQCPVHETLMYDGEDPEPAYRLANALITQNDPLVAVFGRQRRELTDYIKELIEEYGDTCYACDQVMDD
jgi:hypothetical protein